MPDLVEARRLLARLARDLAVPATSIEQQRTLAAMPGLGFRALAAVHDRGSRERERPPEDWLISAAQRLRRGDLEGAGRHAQLARSDPAAAAPALEILSQVADAGGDHRLGVELRLCQAQLGGFTPPLVLALSRSLAQQGQHERAVRWLGNSWHELEGVPEANALLRELVAHVGLPTATRVFAGSHLAGPGGARPDRLDLLVRLDRALQPARPGLDLITEPAAMPGN
jgi:hypothetical protein